VTLKLPGRSGSYAHKTHQARRSRTAAPEPLFLQRIGNAGTAIGMVTGFVDRLDLIHQFQVLLLARTLRTLYPCIIAADRDIEHPTLGSDSKHLLMILDEPVFQGVFMNTAQAFLRFLALR